MSMVSCRSMAALQIVSSELSVVILQTLSYTSQQVIVYSSISLQFDSLVFITSTTLLGMLMGDMFVNLVFKICHISWPVFLSSIGQCLCTTVFQIMPSPFFIPTSHFLISSKSVFQSDCAVKSRVEKPILLRFACIDSFVSFGLPKIIQWQFCSWSLLIVYGLYF